MSPDELLTVTFPPSRLSRRGYDEDAVRDFLLEVHAQYLRLVNDRRWLCEEVHRLRGRIISRKTDGDYHGVPFAAAGGQVSAVRVLSAAQVTADRYIADAQAYSNRLTEEARLRLDEITQQTRRYSDAVLEEAHSRARDAAVSALNAAPSPQTDRERQAAQAELAYLRTFSDVYRAHIRAYTEGILSGIEEWEREGANPAESVLLRM
jgi:DivIVA domain-containing protein